MTALAFVAVAAAATILRAVATQGQHDYDLPWRTLAANTSGAFVLGLILSSGWLGNPVIAATAGLGSFTTFSTVAAETASLIENGRTSRAIAYVGMTVVVGVAAAWFGLSIGDLT